MKVLVLGGTRFVGRHLVSACLDQGDEVTVLHRGRSPSPFGDEVRHIHADRRAPTAEAARALARPWNLVVDTSAVDDGDVRLVPALLGDVGRYLMLSTCGVYRSAPGQRSALSERSATVAAEPPNPARASAARKLRGERALRRRLNRARVPWLIARLGCVIGTHDHAQRLSYWLDRALREGDALIPLRPNQPLSLIDAVDAARFLRRAAGRGLSGVVNVTGPAIRARDFVDCLFGHPRAVAVPAWIDEDFALAHGLRPWSQIPLWLPSSSPELALMSVSSARAVGSGLTYRPLTDSLADCLGWWTRNRSWSPGWLEPGMERELIARWREVAP